MCRVSVLGAGAVGSYVGGMLALNGVDVTLIGRKPHIKRVNEDGLIIRHNKDWVRVGVEATTKASAMSETEWVLLCTKSYDTRKAGKLIKKYATGSVLSLQNGVNNHEILRRVGIECISGIVGFNVMIEEPGVVRLLRQGKIVIGDLYQDRQENAARTLRMGLRVETVRNILPLMWGKLVFNCVNGVSALTRTGLVRGVGNEWFTKSADLILSEAEAVLDKAGIPHEYPSLGIKAFRLALRMPQVIRSLLARAPVTVIPSTLQDRWRGKRLEVNEFNGEVLRRAKESRTPTPYNQRLIELLKEENTLSPKELFSDLTNLNYNSER